MPDYIVLIGFMGLVFVPLYIPIAVTIVDGIRSGRDAVGAIRPVVSGSHARRHDLKLLRRVCLVTLVAIAVQFSLGMILNLYVDIPAAEAHASWLREIETASAALTAHAIIGLLLLVGAVVVVIQVWVVV